MNIFEWLVIAHLLADWLLQSDWMALGKRRKFFALSGLVHYLLYTIIILLFLYSSIKLSRHDMNVPTMGSSKILIYTAGLVFFSHWLIDGTNLIQSWMRLLGQRPQPMVAIVIDQTLHLFILALVATFLI